MSLRFDFCLILLSFSLTNIAGLTYVLICFFGTKYEVDQLENVLQTKIQFIRDGVKNLKAQDDSLKKCALIAERLSKDYESLGKQASALQNVAYDAE